MKLHLGCGQKYLDGYLNIDYPASFHTIQQGGRADQYGDILQLCYAKESIEEIRLHHVFEHFSRPIAVALVAAWNGWLRGGGELRIEVPNFEKMARVAISHFSSSGSKKVALRHIFGSNEATWAVHYEGYSLELLSELLMGFGFRIKSVQKNTWKGTHNIDITGSKQIQVDEKELPKIAEKYLCGFLVSQDDEKQLLSTWMGIFRAQYSKSRPRS